MLQQEQVLYDETVGGLVLLRPSGEPLVDDAPDVDVCRELLSSWLHRFRWDAFFTGTFSRAPRSSETPFVLFSRWLQMMSPFVSRARAAGVPYRWARKPYAAVFHEIGPVTGRDHIHALIGNVDPIRPYCGIPMDLAELGRRRVIRKLTPCCLLHSWNHYGIARAVAFEADKGASHYLSKYSCKGGDGDWRLVGDFEPAGSDPIIPVSWFESLFLRSKVLR